MTPLESLIVRAREKGLGLAVANGKLRVTAPRDRDTELDNLLEELRRHKDQLVSILAEPAPACWNCGAVMDPVTDIYRRHWWACWACAKWV